MNPTAPTAERDQEEPVAGSSAAADAAPPARGEHDGGGEDEGCPICQFIEAGPCKAEHRGWVRCRKDCQATDTDFVEECKHQFMGFFECMLAHRDYYQPFLEAFGSAVPGASAPDAAAAADDSAVVAASGAGDDAVSAQGLQAAGRSNEAAGARLDPGTSLGRDASSGRSGGDGHAAASAG